MSTLTRRLALIVAGITLTSIGGLALVGAAPAGAIDDIPSCSLHPNATITAPGPLSFTNVGTSEQFLQVLDAAGAPTLHNDFLSPGETTPVMAVTPSTAIHWASDVYPVSAYASENWCQRGTTTTSTAPPSTTSTVPETTTSTAPPTTSAPPSTTTSSTPEVTTPPPTAPPSTPAPTVPGTVPETTTSTAPADTSTTTGEPVITVAAPSAIVPADDVVVGASTARLATTGANGVERMVWAGLSALGLGAILVGILRRPRTV
jgi:hypothetical protein